MASDSVRMSAVVEAKVVIIGNQAVGKTSIARRYLDNVFYNQQHSTVGASLMVKRLTVDGCMVKLQIWDTAGQERFRSMTPLFFRGAHAAIIVFDITSRKSFDDMDVWLRDLRMVADNECEVIFVIGNKSDLKMSRQVSVDEAREWSSQVKGIYREVSALNNDGIDELFYDLSTVIHRQFSKTKTPESDEWRDTETLSLTSEPRGCCY